tara:strand:+ start:1760 stop:2464 length:705 start_codon:yes stop_codon:yes gene_type:complete
MSTKIYYAWRTPISRLAEFGRLYDDYGFHLTGDFVKNMMDTVTYEKCHEIWGKYKDNLTWDEFQIHREKMLCYSIVMQFCHEAATKMTVELFDIDFGFNAFLSRAKAYIVPYGNRKVVQSFSPPDWVEEYGYWNNTDQPEHITRRQWKARGNKWDEVALDDWQKNRFMHASIDLKEGVGTERLNQEIFDEEDLLRALIVSSDIKLNVIHGAEIDVEKHILSPLNDRENNVTIFS